MKSKITIGFLAGLLFLPAAWANHVDILNQSRPGGTTHKIIQGLSYSLGAIEVPVGNCAAAVERFKNPEEGKAVYLVISNSELAAESLTGDSSCSVEVTEENLVTILFHSYPKFCSLKSSGLTLESFTKGGSKVGGYHSKYWQTVLGRLLDEVSPGSKPIPYKSSGEAVAGLVAGDVDYIWTARVNEDMNCFLTLNPEGETIFGKEVRPLVEITEHPLASWSYSLVLLINDNFRGLTPEEKRSSLQDTRGYVSQSLWIGSIDEGGAFAFFRKRGYIFDFVNIHSTPQEQVEKFNRGLTALE